MTLKRLAETVACDSDAIRDRGRMLHDLQELHGLSQDLEGCADRVEAVRKTEVILCEAGILEEVSRPPVEALRVLASLFEDDRVVDNPQATARVPIRDLEKWAHDESVRCEQSWKAWRDSVLPDLDEVKAFIGRFNTFINDDRHVRLRFHLAHADQLQRMRLPTSQDDVDDVRKVSRDLTEATRLDGVPERVRGFLEAALAEGATVEILDDSEVRTWLREKGHMARIRVRLDLRVGSDD